jgi:hypothetical protein
VESCPDRGAPAPVRKLLRFALRRGRAALPTIARIGPFRFFFYSNEGNEPPHVHVQQESMVAKFWLNPVALAASGGFSAAELKTVEGLVSEQRQHFLEEWNAFFRGRG